MDQPVRRRKTDAKLKPRPKEYGSMRELKLAIEKAHTRLVGDNHIRRWGDRK